MKESYVKGLANHDGPESCVEWRDSLDEALTGEKCRLGIEPRNAQARDADPVELRGRRESASRKGEACWYPARSETPGMYGNNLRENREILRPPKPARLGRIEKSKDVRR
jgi:hypothetical protein